MNYLFYWVVLPQKPCKDTKIFLFCEVLYITFLSFMVNYFYNIKNARQTSVGGLPRNTFILYALLLLCAQTCTTQIEDNSKIKYQSE